MVYCGHDHICQDKEGRYCAVCGERLSLVDTENEKEKVGNIIENFIIYFTTDDKEREEMFKALETYLEEGEPF